MKTITKLSFLLTLFTVLFFACKKEVSFEQGNSNASVGSLQADGGGGCLGAVVSGTYYKDTTLNASHFSNVNVSVDTAGSYTITTDTIQGYYFNASGNFSGTGTQVVKLTGKGKPLSAGTHIFTVRYNGTFCEFSVTVTVATGGSSAFTVNCTSPVISGTYMVGTALTAANMVTLNVTVTAIGTWSVSTAPSVNGITFSGSGTFTSTAAGQTIILTATGQTPVASGTNSFTVTGGTGTCNFPITFTALPDYFPRTTNSNWSYEYDSDLNDSILVQVISPTHTAGANTYKIFMYTDDVTFGFDTLGYYRRANADYFEWGDLSWGIFDVPTRGEYIFLKDNQTVGTTWNSPQFSGPYTDQFGSTTTITLRWELSIVQQNANVTAGPLNTNYANTIEVRQELRLLVGSNWILQFYFRNYYARDKGLIKQDGFDNTNTLVYEQEVRRLVIY